MGNIIGGDSAVFPSADVWGKRTVSYPSPFFDLAQSYMPTNVKEMFRWCKFYYFKHPLISPVINKLAEFPITDLIYDTQNDDNRKWWQDLLEDIMCFRQIAIGIGLDFYTYGNAFVSINVPIIKRLECPMCKTSQSLGSVDWKWKNYKFHAYCEECKYNGPMKVVEIQTKNRYDYNFIRWDPANIDIEYNPITGKSTYYYTIPNYLINHIKQGKKTVLETIPQVFIESVQLERKIRFNTQNFYHFKRETLAERDQEWGKPLIYPALQSIFYMQVLHRAQEAIAMQHIVPLWVLFPQATPTMDPYTTLNLDNWKSHVEDELIKWKRDPNYIPVMPMPIGNAVIGGEGRGLLLGPEMQQLSQNILASLGVPQEFVFGGLSYTGTSVTLRMLENQLIGHARGIHRFLNKFAVPFLAKALNKQELPVRMVDFKMADDIQRKQIMLQLNAGNKIADQTLLEAVEPTLSYKSELDKLMQELKDKMEYAKEQNLKNVEIQGVSQLSSTAYQMEAMKIQQEGQMRIQAEIMQELQQKAQQGDPIAAQLLQGMMQQQMGAQPGAQPGQDPNAQGGQQQQGGDPNAQGQQQGGEDQIQQIVQLAVMDPQQLEQAVQQGQVDQAMAQQAQQFRQAADQYSPEQLQQMVQQGQMDQQSAQIVQMIQEELQNQQAGGQAAAGPGAPQGEGGPAPEQADMVGADGMTPDESGAAFQSGNPGLQSAGAQQLAVTYAKQLMTLPPEARKAMASRMQSTMPQLYGIVMNTYGQMSQAVQQGQKVLNQ